MKQINLVKLELHNFKGIKGMTLEFPDNYHEIKGKNASGKTTVFDAFTWLLFGKDSLDRKDFNIKTIQSNGSPRHKLDYSVTGVLWVGTPEGTSQEITLKRVYREKWVTKRGSEESEFSGHETLYFWNEVPMQQGEYEAKISEIVPEATFKLITSPYYFSNVLKWKDRRDLLIELAGAISPMDIAAGDKDVFALIELMQAEKKDIEDLKKEYAAKKKLLKKSIEEIPSRIDEVERSKPEPIDEKALKADVKRYEAEITQIQASMMDATKAAEAQNMKFLELTEEAGQVQKLISEIERDAKRKIADDMDKQDSLLSGKRGELRRAMTRRDEAEAEINDLKKAIDHRDAKIESLRQEWVKINQSEAKYTEGDTHCPTCKREYDNVDEIRETLETNHNKYKTETLAQLSAQGKEMKTANEKDRERLSALETDLEDLKAQIVAANGEVVKMQQPKELVTVEQLLEGNDLYSEYKDKLAEINEALSNRVAVSNDVLENRHKELTSMLDQAKADLSKADAIAKADARITELSEEERGLAQQIATLERQEFVIEKYTRKQVDLIEKKVNIHFNTVTFKLFDQQINGGLKETCEALIKGVPYSDANNAARINAGLDIINTFSDHYGVSAPIFIDNAESINELIPSKGQMIAMYVTTDENLVITTK
jgi:DNA repair protein SbcC/Rad50